MKIISILRIKNEILVIRECLANLSSLVDEILIVDNGSTDGTLEVYKEFKKVTKVIKTEGFGEGRDKCLLLEEAKKRNPDWILWMDADEVFEEGFTRREVEKIMNYGYDRVAFRLCHFWLNKTHCRLDGKWFFYSLRFQPRMFRNLVGIYFENKKIHSGFIKGMNSKILLSPYRIKHYGYIDKKKISEKYNSYKSVDKSISYEHLNPDNKGFLYRFRNYNYDLEISIYGYIYRVISDIIWITSKFGLNELIYGFFKNEKNK